MTAVAGTEFRPSAAVERVRVGSLRVPQPPSGDEIVSLAMGEPGFDTPPGIRLAAHGALETGYTHYAHPHGDPELRQVLAERLTAFTPDDAHLQNHGVAVRPGSEFGRAGEHHIRLSFAAEPSAIIAGLERIRPGLAHLDHVEAHR